MQTPSAGGLYGLFLTERRPRRGTSFLLSHHFAQCVRCAARAVFNDTAAKTCQNWQVCWKFGFSGLAKKLRNEMASSNFQKTCQRRAWGISVKKLLTKNSRNWQKSKFPKTCQFGKFFYQIRVVKNDPIRCVCAALGLEKIRHGLLLLYALP